MNEFDDRVLRALAKWPNVPACFGWLRLDRRGRWLLEDEAISHRGAIAYLGRNYAADTYGRWFVQNGPQRVYCNLDHSPWVYRFDGDGRLVTHTGREIDSIKQVIVDQEGDLALSTELGLGLLEDRDLAAFLARLEERPSDNDISNGASAQFAELINGTRSTFNIRWRGVRTQVISMSSEDIPRVYGYTRIPRPLDTD